MCRIGAIKSKKKLHPSIALKLMRSQQEGHDDSGFAFVMQDMGGHFENYKDLPLLSMAATVEGTRLAEDILREIGFTRVMQWSPDINNKKGLKIEAMPNYIFEVLQYPKSYKHATKEEKEELLIDTAIKLRKTLEETKKEVGMVIESVDNIEVAYELGKLHNIEMPIVETVYKVLYENLDPQEAVKDLMTRDKKME